MGGPTGGAMGGPMGGAMGGPMLLQLYGTHDRLRHTARHAATPYLTLL